MFVNLVWFVIGAVVASCLIAEGLGLAKALVLWVSDLFESGKLENIVNRLVVGWFLLMFFIIGSSVVALVVR